MELIQLTDLRKTYMIGGVTIEALAGVSLDIGTEEFVAIWSLGVRKVHADAHSWLSR